MAAFDRRAEMLCRASIEDGAKARWRQYREIWEYVEMDTTGVAPGRAGRSPKDACRRRAILRHFGDHADPAPRPDGAPCCDVCDGRLVPKLPPPSLEAIADLDDAIISVAQMAQPAVGRTTCAEIVHGARTKKIERNSYDGLPAYATSPHMRRADILARVDELIDAGRLATTKGPYPVLGPVGS